jgi:flagellar hook protein FlgE
MNASRIAAAGAIDAGNRLAASAQRTVSGKADLAAEAVEQASDKAAFSASAAVLRASDDMMKHLLDIKV